ncbi:MAG: DUF4271 domain-containing protein [Bacteroidales bacterium]|nr:DUF4271 domain-containing protein [Bacteroidales bacterium]MDY0215492.1 DUF4271 domain-containing protein [Bacteroidales bacterium]
MQVEIDTTIQTSFYGIPYQEVSRSTFYDSTELKTKPENIISFYREDLFDNQKDTSLVPSVFQNHLLVPSHNSKILIDKRSDDWLLIPFLIVLVLFIYISKNFYQRSLQALKAPFSKRGMNQLERDGNVLKENIKYPIYLIEIITVTLIIFQSLRYFSLGIDVSYPPPKIFIFISIAYSTFILIKNQILNLLAYIFDTSEETSLYKVEGFLLLGVGSVVLIPLLFAFQYTQMALFLYAGLIFIILLVVYKLLKGFQIWGRAHHYFKIFAYLCTVEVLPYLLIAKTILNIIK